MKISLVTTCFNEMSSIASWKAGVMNQARRADEVVVVDGGSTDGTTEYLEQWAMEDPSLKVIRRKSTVAAGRNIAIAAATHEHIASTDMGVRLDPQWLAELVKPWEADPTLDVVMGNYDVERYTSPTAAARADSALNKVSTAFAVSQDGRVSRREGVFPSNRSVAYTKTVWRKLGGLPEDLTRCADDSVFGRQMIQEGLKIAFAPNAFVYWYRPADFRSYWKEQFGYGRGRGEAALTTPFVIRMYRRGFLPRWFVPLSNGFRWATQRKALSAVSELLAKRDPIGAASVIPLAFGCGYSFAKGYLIGERHGAEHCNSCRSRLKGEVI